MKKDQLLEAHHDAILASASAIYHASLDGVEPDPTISRVNILPQNLGDMSESDVYGARLAEAQVNVIARGVGSLAVLSDLAEKGGVRGAVAKFEIGARKVMERPYTKQALEAGGIVDKLRGTHTPRQHQIA